MRTDRIDEALETFSDLRTLVGNDDPLIKAGKERVATYFGELPEMAAVGMMMITDMMMSMLSEEEKESHLVALIGRSVGALGMAATELVQERTGNQPRIGEPEDAC